MLSLGASHGILSLLHPLHLVAEGSPAPGQYEDSGFFGFGSNVLSQMPLALGLSFPNSRNEKAGPDGLCRLYWC